MARQHTADCPAQLAWDIPGACTCAGRPAPRQRPAPAGWRDPSDVEPAIRDAYDPLADDLRGRD